MLTNNTDIKNAFQALALDERRKAFSPTLWHLPEAPPKKDGEPDQSIEEKLVEKRMQVDKAAAAWDLKKLDKKVPLADRQGLKSAYNKARRELCRTQEYSKKPSTLRQVWFPGVHTPEAVQAILWKTRVILKVSLDPCHASLECLC